MRFRISLLLEFFHMEGIYYIFYHQPQCFVFLLYWHNTQPSEFNWDYLSLFSKKLFFSILLIPLHPVSLDHHCSIKSTVLNQVFRLPFDIRTVSFAMVLYFQSTWLVIAPQKAYLYLICVFVVFLRSPSGDNLGWFITSHNTRSK